MQLSCFAVLFQFIVIKIVTAYSITPRHPPSQLYSESAQNVNQQLLKSLLTSRYNEANFPERLEILTAALQHMPSKNQNKRNKISLPDLLKHAALQSLKTAANVYKRNGDLSPELPGKVGVLKKAEFSEAFPEQFEILKRIQLPATLPGQLEMQREIEMRGKSSGRFMLPGKNGLVLAVASDNEVLDSMPRNYDAPKKTIISYY